MLAELTQTKRFLLNDEIFLDENKLVIRTKNVNDD